ncbi:MAG: YggU family protein [Hahellaceae bacterium]|nr:YggU family protein [Hahellaceae bacterium]MCP5168421.1 YggU family protein [Hahellaceae bacterium]
MQWQGDRLILTCHLQPKAKTDEFCGLHGDSLKIRITAPPVDGKANQHLLKFLAKSFGVRQQQVSLISGETSRHKRIQIEKPTQFPNIPNITFSNENA